MTHLAGPNPVMEAGEAPLAYHQCRDCEAIYFEPKVDCDHCASVGTVEAMSEADILACALLWGSPSIIGPHILDFYDQGSLVLVGHESDACVFLPESV